MKKKLNLIGSILSVVALTILSGIEAFASFWLGGLIADITDQPLNTLTIVLYLLLGLNLLALVLNALIIKPSLNEENYRKKFILIIITIITNFANIGLILYFIISSSGSSIILHIILLAVLLVGTILIIIDLIKDRKNLKTLKPTTIQTNNIDDEDEEIAEKQENTKDEL